MPMNRFVKRIMSCEIRVFVCVLMVLSTSTSMALGADATTVLYKINASSGNLERVGEGKVGKIDPSLKHPDSGFVRGHVWIGHDLQIGWVKPPTVKPACATSKPRCWNVPVIAMPIVRERKPCLRFYNEVNVNVQLQMPQMPRPVVHMPCGVPSCCASRSALLGGGTVVLTIAIRNTAPPLRIQTVVPRQSVFYNIRTYAA